MRNRFRKYLTPPVFEDNDEKSRIAGLLNSILLFVIIATSLALPILALSTEQVNILPLLVLVVPFILINIAAYVLMRRGNVVLASNVFLINLSIGIFGAYAFSESQSPGALLSLTILIAFTTLLLEPRAIIRLIAIIIIFTLIVFLAQARGWISPAFRATTDPISNWISTSFTFILVGTGLYLSSISLRRALENAHASRESLRVSNRELEELRQALELRVMERTAELEKRATQLQTVSVVARTITALQDLKQLLPEITKLVSEQFGFYHTGIFLIDDAREYAVLHAANSEGGRRMLNRRHQLRLDATSIVGYATSRGEPRVALDVETDTVFFNNPDLPETRSEMALPLQAGGRTIGALDVQSRETNAFSQEDIYVLTILADQIAIAIENARLFGESRNALSESQSTIEKYVKQAWGSFAQQAKRAGFVFDGKQVFPLEKGTRREPIKSAMKTGKLSLEKASSTIAVPIKLRGQLIGVLDVRSKNGQRQWTGDEIKLLEAAAERAALALENARLVDSAQRRAARERIIGEISSKIGAASNFDTILQTAVEELGRKIGGAEVTLEIESEQK
jgi:GAF domain-containing protein